MRKIPVYHFIIMIFIFSTSMADADSYNVAQRWFSEDYWGQPVTAFSTEAEAVYFNIMVNTGGNTPPLDLKWYGPDGVEETNLGTDTKIVFKYTQGIVIGVWGKMLIEGMNRKQGQWRVEHYAYGSMDGSEDWHLMLMETFQIGTLDDPQIIFNVSGTWDYTESITWSDCDGGPYDPETGSVSISKVEDDISMDDSGIKYTGKADGNTYTLNASYPDDGGTAAVEVIFILSSDTMGSGSVAWEWTDGVTTCKGGHKLSLSRDAQDIPLGESGGDGNSSGTCFIAHCFDDV